MSGRFDSCNLPPWQPGEEPAGGDVQCEATDGNYICTRPPHDDTNHVAHAEHPERGLYICERWTS